MNGKLKSRDEIQALRDKKNKLVVDSNEMAEVLNDQFESVFKNDKYRYHHEFLKRTAVSFNVENILKKLNFIEIETRLINKDGNKTSDSIKIPSGTQKM